MVKFIFLLSALVFGAIAFTFVISALSLAIIDDKEDMSVIKDAFVCMIIAIILWVMSLAI